MKKAPPRPVQYFSDEYLERWRAMKPEGVLAFLESFRLLHGGPGSSEVPSARNGARIPVHPWRQGRVRQEGGA